MKAETTTSYHERIRRAVHHLEAHLDDPLRLDELASVACFSPFHFHRVFRGIVGESVKEHIRRLRLERAAHCLRRADTPVVQLALEAGYDTHESFTRAFEAMFGVSPSAFRKNGGPLHPVTQTPAPPRPVEAEIRRIGPFRVAYIRHVGPYDQVGAAWQKLMAWAGPQRLLGPNMRILGISHDDPEITPPDRLRYDAALVVPAHVQPSGEVGILDLEAREYAVAKHHGPYDKLGESYAGLCGLWVPQNGRELGDGPAIEFYLNSPYDTPPEQLLTEICMPLK